MNAKELIEQIASREACRKVITHPGGNVSLEGVCGSLLPLLAAVRARTTAGVHLVVAEDREAASYIYSDIYNIFEAYGEPEGSVLLMPTAYKRAITTGREDPAGIALRTNVLNAIAQHSTAKGEHPPLVICTFPEALSEKVVSREKLRDATLTLKIGEKVDIPFVEQILIQNGFQRVDFVSEPGHFAVRGGIIDVFSFADNHPYRLEFFGNEIESLRSFTISTQLSNGNLTEVEIVPNLKRGDQNSRVKENRVSLAQYIGGANQDGTGGGQGATLWIVGPQNVTAKLDAIRKKLLEEIEDPRQIGENVTSANEFARDTEGWTTFSAFGSFVRSGSGKKPTVIDLGARPQPTFNKNFDLLVSTVREDAAAGVKTYILSDNMAQIERLENIFAHEGSSVLFEGVHLTLHGGFGGEALGCWLLTDHQIFDRYHKVKIHNEIDRSEGLTIAELNMLKVGDYVVHIDHGVGRFSGLVRTVEGGAKREFIKLVYRDGDVLMVGVHNLHRISRYKSGDVEVLPPVHKLGGGAWQRLKSTTKSKVKDIARELIALYAKRKATRGYAFSHDSYMQNELEASFLYEDTPDQLSTTQSVKADMEAPEPMDRLVCGDVGFGKTEIAIRAAFKAATDGKQVAVLVPTTVLSLQHYRTFSRRLKNFPVRVENFSRVKSAKQTSEILADLKAGRIDIIIGTHKLLGKTVEFKDLGLLIIDEEQKFGVANKEKLREFRANIDTLTLTATPIPRTLQFSLMGARDMSLISTPPPNRQPVTTEVLTFDEDTIREAVDYELMRGGQVFFLHNRVQTIEHMAAVIRHICPRARVAVGHGQMSPVELEKVMMDFIYAEYDVFVATTIIESGIDIPNANTIIINDAQRFGLSDLHQLRGRVGRTNRKAFCYLLTPPEGVVSADAHRRLRAIEEFSDLGSGFNIAMQDLDIRGAGNILGGEQSGFVSDIGFETYQKIINEAVAELRAEAGIEMAEGDLAAVVDCVVESESGAHLPDEYIGSTAEKIRLYRELDGIGTQEQLDAFVARLRDRFGEPPAEALELLDVVMLRAEAGAMAVERLVYKGGVAVLHFSANQALPFFKGEGFRELLSRVVRDGARYKLAQKGDRVVLSIRGARNFAELRATLKVLSGKI